MILRGPKFSIWIPSAPAGNQDLAILATELIRSGEKPSGPRLHGKAIGGGPGTNWPTISVSNATVNEIGNVSALVAPGSGGLNQPKDLVIGPDGNVNVASAGTNSVIRYTPNGFDSLDAILKRSAAG